MMINNNDSFIFDFMLGSEDIRNLGQKSFYRLFLINPVISGISAAFLLASFVPDKTLSNINSYLVAIFPSLSLSNTMVAILMTFLIGFLSGYLKHLRLIFLIVKSKIMSLKGNIQSSDINQSLPCRFIVNKEYIKKIQGDKTAIFSWDMFQSLQFIKDKHFLIAYVAIGPQKKLNFWLAIPLNALDQQQLSINNFMQQIQNAVPNNIHQSSISTRNNIVARYIFAPASIK